MKKLFKIILVIFWMVLIFSFSMDQGEASTGKSNSIIDFVSEFILRREISYEEREMIREKYVIPVRKGAHFMIYFLLGFSFLSLLKEYSLINRKGIYYSILFVLLYACSDEIHQLFVSGRSGEVIDVLIDTIGGSLGIFSLYYYYLRRKKYE